MKGNLCFLYFLWKNTIFSLINLKKKKNVFLLNPFCMQMRWDFSAFGSTYEYYFFYKMVGGFRFSLHWSSCKAFHFTTFAAIARWTHQQGSKFCKICNETILNYMQISWNLVGKKSFQSKEDFWDEKNCLAEKCFGSLCFHEAKNALGKQFSNCCTELFSKYALSNTICTTFLLLSSMNHWIENTKHSRIDHEIV